VEEGRRQRILTGFDQKKLETLPAQRQIGFNSRSGCRRKSRPDEPAHETPSMAIELNWKESCTSLRAGRYRNAAKKMYHNDTDRRIILQTNTLPAGKPLFLKMYLSGDIAD
jgi:hypothetical protein